MEARRFVDVYGHHGFVFTDAGRLMLEHCTNGVWGCCPLTVRGHGVRAENQAAMRHLNRKAHHGVEPERLRGLCHA